MHPAIQLAIVLLAAAALWFACGRRTKKFDLSVLPEQFVVFDLETTGLRPDSHEIIEIGAVRVNRDSRRHETFQVFVKPDKRVPRKITELTGVSQEMVDERGVALEKAIAEFQKFAGGLRLVSYNAAFDMAFLRNAAAKCGKEIPNAVSCAWLMARRAWPWRESFKLADIAKDGGASTSGAHRALKDCEMTMVVYTAAAATLGRVD